MLYNHNFYVDPYWKQLIEKRVVSHIPLAFNNAVHSVSCKKNPCLLTINHAILKIFKALYPIEDNLCFTSTAELKDVEELSR